MQIHLPDKSHSLTLSEKLYYIESQKLPLQPSKVTEVFSSFCKKWIGGSRT